MYVFMYVSMYVFTYVSMSEYAFEDTHILRYTGIQTHTYTYLQRHHQCALRHIQALIAQGLSNKGYNRSGGGVTVKNGCGVDGVPWQHFIRSEVGEGTGGVDLKGGTGVGISVSGRYVDIHGCNTKLVGNANHTHRISVIDNINITHIIS